MNRLVYVCHPYRGDEPNNRTMMRGICQGIIDSGDIPIATALYFPQFLDDSDPQERRQGIDAGLYLLARCREIRIFGTPKSLSEGMLAEVRMAVALGIPRRWMRETPDDETAALAQE